MTRPRRLLQAGLFMLSLSPLVLLVHMGLHTRLIHDDFIYTAIGRELGAWGVTVHFFNAWSPAYTTVYIKGALSPLGVLLPPLSILLITGLWLLGFYLLLRESLAWLGLEGPRRRVAGGLAALLAAATINAFYSPQSYYWFSSNMTYSLPLGAVAGCLTLAIWVVKMSDNLAILYRGAALCALIMFLTAGAAEMYVVFQSVFVALLAALSLAIVDRRRRRALALVAGAMLLATLAGLVIQATSPGVANRLALDAQRYGPPVDSLTLLATLTAQLTFESIGRPTAFAGFVLMLAASLFVALTMLKPSKPPGTELPPRRLSDAVRLGLAAQLVFLPIMLAHQSDSGQLLGRYSLSYALVLGLHIVLLSSFAAAVWRRRALQRAFEQRPQYFPFVWALLLLGFLLLFAMTQVRRIDSRASTYLFFSALSLLTMLALLKPAQAADRRAKTLGAAALAIMPVAWLTIAALYCVTFIGHGFTADRIMSGSAWLQVAAGLIWGLYLGYLLKTFPAGYDLRPVWERRLALGSLATALVVAGGIFFGQARMLPNLQVYTADWDARHEFIVRQRDSGITQIEVAPLSFDLADYLGLGTLRSAESFYDVETIAKVGDGG